MQQHKAQTHSGSHANLNINRAHKRAKLVKWQAEIAVLTPAAYGNRAARRAPLRARNLANNDTSVPV